MRKETYPQNEMLKGTLDMMILRTLIRGDAQGHTMAKVIEQTSEELLQVVRETSRWRQMTRAIGLVFGEERGAQ
jgi:PadR family transcriptional regulator, regulatory protein PadR